MSVKTYALVGLGGRSALFKEAFQKQYKETTKLLAICDKNEGRLKISQNEFEIVNPEIGCYLSDDFDKLLAEHHPDIVIVCTMDSTHDDYICMALEAGCNVITEKPMTTDEKKCQKIIDAVKKTGKSVRVTFNYRYSPPRTQIKDLLMLGVIGKVFSVEFQWMLDTWHGADYYRRWHRNKNNSGGLMVHKATHHFDLMNWWLGSRPVSVFAEGDKVFYNARQAKCYGLENHGDRCLECSVKDRCNYYLDINSYDIMKNLYFNCEKHDGYFRDKCVFSDDIDIEDTMNVIVKYKSDAILSYSLNSFSPWEGYKVAFNGTKGRLEQECHETSYLNGDGSVQGAFQAESSSIKVYPHFKTPYEIEVKESKGGHGGGDAILLNDIFGDPVNDPYFRAADYVQGAYSILVGVAANKSIASGQKIFIDDLVKGLNEPITPLMPNGDEKIEYVTRSYRSANGEKMLASTPLNIDAPQ